MGLSSKPSRRIVIPAALAKVIEIDPERLGGIPIFRDTRVPVKALFDYVRAGESIGTFLSEFPGVTREQVMAVLEAASAEFLDHLEAA